LADANNQTDHHGLSDQRPVYGRTGVVNDVGKPFTTEKDASVMQLISATPGAHENDESRAQPYEQAGYEIRLGKW
jgi:hypothetical protein